MDVVGGALCAIGAASLLRGSPGDSVGALLLFMGFYGVHRALRTGASQALIAAPTIVWLAFNLWTFVPESLVDGISKASPTVERAPEAIGSIVLVAALLAMVAVARERLGAGLSTLALVALALSLLLRITPSTGRESLESSFTLLLTGMTKGWGFVARTLGALCMILIGVGPIPVRPLPRRGGAVAGAIGGTLLAAGIVGLPTTIHTYNEGALGVFVLLWLTGGILSAIGLGAMARAGATPAGWIGVGATVLGLVMLVPALAIFEKTSSNAYGFVMATPFGLLGIGVALFGWKGAPLEVARKALGVAFVTAFATGTLAWIAVFLARARVTNAREPWSLARLATEPLATYGLLLWAALLLYLAWPPGPKAPAAMPLPAPPAPQGPPPGWAPPRPR